MGEPGLKKGKKMPSIELDGESDATFVLKDGKIVRSDTTGEIRPVSSPERLQDRMRFEAHDPRAPKRPHE